MRCVWWLVLVVLTGLVAASAPALEWNPFDNLSVSPFSIKKSLPFTEVGGDRVFTVYSASHEEPVRILAVPVVPEPRQRRLVTGLARRYLLAVGPLTGHAIMAGDVLPAEQAWREEKLIDQIVRGHRTAGRLRPADLEGYLPHVDANVVLVIELPRYEQRWGGFAKETVLQMRADAYLASTGERLFEVEETVRGRNSHRGQMFEALEADLIEAMKQATRRELGKLNRLTPPPAEAMMVAR